MSLKKLGLGLGALLVLVWFYFTPYIAVWGLKSAAEAKDANQMSVYINYPALKESLKSLFSAKVAHEVGSAQGNPFAAAGAVVAGAMIGPMVDAMVSPEGLSAMINQGKKPQSGSAQANAEPKALNDNQKAEMSYEGLNQFVVNVLSKDGKGDPVGLVFTREGVLSSWKLSALRIKVF